MEQSKSSSRIIDNQGLYPKQLSSYLKLCILLAFNIKSVCVFSQVDLHGMINTHWSEIRVIRIHYTSTGCITAYDALGRCCGLKVAKHWAWVKLYEQPSIWRTLGRTSGKKSSSNKNLPEELHGASSSRPPPARRDQVQPPGNSQPTAYSLRL